MTFFERIKYWFIKRKPQAIYDRTLMKNPLREFIYLDEVSLRSLLSSKKGEITSSTSTEINQSVENEIRDTMSIGSTNVAKMEGTSRFQTRNSSTLQTAKKATVQSWFRELDNIKGIRLIETVQQVQPFEAVEGISKCSNPSVCINSEKIKRGDMIEFRVRLTTDPIFHMVTLMSEFQGMAKDFPEMMGDENALKQITEVEGITLVLRRLLAGLIPVRAKVLDYVVYQFEDVQYIIHKDSLKNLNLDVQPLEIVCVTELDAYWKDIRRILFSDAEFTMLARVSKTGLQSSWNPIKLADLMRGLVPDLSEQLNSATDLLFNTDHTIKTQIDESANLRNSLLLYAQSIFKSSKSKAGADEMELIEKQIEALEISEHKVSSQKEAFLKTRELVSQIIDTDITPDQDLEFREQARDHGDLPYFKSLQAEPQITPKVVTEKSKKAEHILDVEVVAMYW